MAFFESVWYLVVLLAVIAAGVVIFLLDRTKKEANNKVIIFVTILWFLPLLFYVATIGMGFAPAFWTSSFLKANTALVEAAPTVLKWVGIVALIAVDLALAVVMGNVYEDKTGRNKTPIIVLCFFLAPVGYFYVASVPDYVLRLDIEKMKDQILEERKIAPISK